jgi:uncharacterized glyoxalase superfamily protein PhnB
MKMTDTSNRSDFIPEGWHSVTPRLFADDAKELVEFLKNVFDATGEYTDDRPSILKIGDSIVMIGDSAVRNTTAAFLYLYVKDADATYQRAVTAGAHILEEPRDTPYGDRRCMIEDPGGNTWQIATYRG